MKSNKDQIQAAIAQIKEISPAPRILAKALALLRSPYSDGDEIAKLISSDATLTADMIRSANSAFYGSSEQKVTSLGQAVQKIGFTETIRLLSLSVSRVMTGRDLKSYGISSVEFWGESLMNALFVSELAKATNGVSADEAYTAGLIRYIGRLAINQSMQTVGGGILWTGPETLTEWELEHVGMTQAEAGGLLLTMWQFPQDLIDAIRGQDDPSILKDYSWLAYALCFSSKVLPLGMGPAFLDKEILKALVIPEDSEFMQRNNLSRQEVEAVLETTQALWADVVTNFSKRN